MPRGGARNGAPGRAYPERTDLNTMPRQLPVTTGPSQSYGQSAALERSQQAVPMARPTRPPPIDLDAPTTRPDEPVTAGAPFGAGPGPEVLGIPQPQTWLDLARSILDADGYSQDLADAIEDMEG